MSQLRFNHVFFVLMLLAVLSAEFSPRIGQMAQGQLQGLFRPIASPVYSLAGWVYDKASPKKVVDDASPDQPRGTEEVYRENTDLRMQVATLTADLDHLQELNADRERLGDLRSRCTPVPVAAGDGALRDSLMLQASSFSGLREDMAVICPDGVIGRLKQVGVGAARVQTVWDNGSRVSVSFMRLNKDETGQSQMIKVPYAECIAVGQGEKKGKRTLLVTNQTWKQLKESIAVNDWAMLNDRDWGNIAYRIGRVSAVTPQQGVPGFGQIEIESMVDVNRLKEVMVVTR